MRLIDIDDDRNCFCGFDGEYEKWNIDPDVLEAAEAKMERVVTNFDRIRAMSDEEMAEWLADNEWGRFPKSKKGWLDWLRSQAEEET